MSEALIIGIGGTPREKSLSRAALRSGLGVAESMGARTLLIDPWELQLPMYHPEFGLEDYKPHERASIERLVDACYEASGMLWACPTYHGTVTGLFKNTLDLIEFLSESIPPYLTGKPIGLISINDSKTFSAMSNSVHELRGWLPPTHVLLKKADFDDTPALVSETGLRQVTRLTQEVLGFLGHAGG